MSAMSEPITPRRDATAVFARLSLVFLLLMLVTTTMHHGFRFGAGWSWKGLLIIAIALLLHRAALTMRGRWASIIYAGYVALTVLAFGILDGFLDHVLKIVGFQNVTLLEGSDAIHVETVFRLWSQDATYWFYEGTGALAFAFAVPAVWYTGRFLMARLS